MTYLQRIREATRRLRIAERKAIHILGGICECCETTSLLTLYRPMPAAFYHWRSVFSGLQEQVIQYALDGLIHCRCAACRQFSAQNDNRGARHETLRQAEWPYGVP